MFLFIKSFKEKLNKKYAFLENVVCDTKNNLLFFAIKDDTTNDTIISFDESFCIKTSIINYKNDEGTYLKGDMCRYRVELKNIYDTFFPNVNQDILKIYNSTMNNCEQYLFQLEEYVSNCNIEHFKLYCMFNNTNTNICLKTFLIFKNIFKIKQHDDSIFNNLMITYGNIIRRIFENMKKYYKIIETGDYVSFDVCSIPSEYISICKDIKMFLDKTVKILDNTTKAEKKEYFCYNENCTSSHKACLLKLNMDKNDMNNFKHICKLGNLWHNFSAEPDLHEINNLSIPLNNNNANTFTNITSRNYFQLNYGNTIDLHTKTLNTFANMTIKLFGVTDNYNTHIINYICKAIVVV